MGPRAGRSLPNTASWICWPGLHVAPEHHAVGRVEAPDQVAAALPQHARQLPVHPHLGVVVHDDLEDDRRARGSKLPIRSGIVIFVRYQLKQSRPVERRCSRLAGVDHLPLRVIEVDAPGLGQVSRESDSARPDGFRSGPGPFESTSTIRVSL